MKPTTHKPTTTSRPTTTTPRPTETTRRPSLGKSQQQQQKEERKVVILNREELDQVIDYIRKKSAAVKTEVAPSKSKNIPSTAAPLPSRSTDESFYLLPNYPTPLRLAVVKSAAEYPHSSVDFRGDVMVLLDRNGMPVAAVRP
jgi:hypothetical protein